MNLSIFNSEKSASKYFWTLFGLSSILLLIVFLFNIIIDPFHSYQLMNLNLITEKPFLGVDNRANKICTIRKGGYQNIIMGSSTAEFGYRPDHQAWEGGQTYNYGIDGPNIFEHYRFLQHAVATNNIEKLFISLDFFSFNINWFAADLEGDWLSVNEKMEPNKFYLKQFLSAFTLRTTIYSFRTLLNFNKPSAFKLNGFIDRNLMSKLKYAGDQNRRFNDTLGFIKTVLLPLPNSRFDFERSDKNSRYYKYAGDRNTFEIFSKIIKLAADKNIDTYIVIPPFHIEQMKMMDENGLHEKYEFWKKTVREIVCNKQTGGHRTLWEFDGASAITSERIPGLNEVGELKYFYDPHHFKPITGDIILDKVLNNPSSSEYPEFGRLYSCS